MNVDSIILMNTNNHHVGFTYRREFALMNYLLGIALNTSYTQLTKHKLAVD